MTELGGSIDPLELDLLEGLAGGVDEHGLAESHDTLLNTWNGTLNDKEVVLDLTVSNEATHWGDLLLGDVELGRGVTLINTGTDTVDLVVARGTVVVSVLTGTGNSPLDVGWMPSTNTGDLTETLVGLSRKLLGTPSGGDTLETLTLGDGDNVNHLILLEDGGDLDWLLEKTGGEVDLVGDGATVDLDLHEVGLLLLKRSLADLGVGEDTDDGAVLLDALELAGDGRAGGLGVLLGVLGEGLFLGLVPVLVESALNFIAQMLSPDGSEGSKSSWGLDVTNKTNNDHL